tara:strand:- start:906 stop:1478 length:573 start_codon:yes stop_codon:yes gene_type:complete
MIGKRKSINVINRTGTPVMSVCSAIGRGDDLSLIKQKFPVTDKEIMDVIHFFCNNVDFDQHHLSVFKKVEFEQNRIAVQLDEISAEFYLRMLNRYIFKFKKLQDFEDMLEEGLKMTFGVCIKLSQKLLSDGYDITADKEILNPVLDSGFYKELKIFLTMTGRNITDEFAKINIDDFDKVEFELLENDFER